MFSALRLTAAQRDSNEVPWAAPALTHHFRLVDCPRGPNRPCTRYLRLEELSRRAENRGRAVVDVIDRFMDLHARAYPHQPRGFAAPMPGGATH